MVFACHQKTFPAVTGSGQAAAPEFAFFLNSCQHPQPHEGFRVIRVTKCLVEMCKSRMKSALRSVAMCVGDEFQRPEEENFKSCVFSVPVQTELSGSSS